MIRCTFALLLLLTPLGFAAENDSTLWATFEGTGDGPGAGKKVVLVSGDEEYRSEEALTQLGKILSVRHGFDCTVLYAINPETGTVDPNRTNNIPGLKALRDADLMVIFTRFRNLPDDQMLEIENYLESGRPVLGIRTATHAFNVPRNGKWAYFGNGYNGEKSDWKDGFGRLVLGEKWISHHGRHKHESTRGIPSENAADDPVLRGVTAENTWGPTDVYGVRLPLPGDSQPLVYGQVVAREGEFDGNDPLYGMRPTDTEPVAKKNNPMMPIVWRKSYQLPGGEKGTAIASTIGSSTDLLSEGVRRVLVQSAFDLVGLADKIPAGGVDVDLVGNYKPTAYGFHRGNYWGERGLTPKDFSVIED